MTDRFIFDFECSNCFRFDKLNIPRLNIEQKYTTIFKQYGDEVEEIKKVKFLTKQGVMLDHKIQAFLSILCSWGFGACLMNGNILCDLLCDLLLRLYILHNFGQHADVLLSD